MTQQRPSMGLVARGVAIFFAFLTAMLFLWVARSILIVTFLAVLFGLALSAGVDRLERWNIRRPLGAIAITLAFLGLLAGIGAMIAPTLRAQTDELETELPRSLDQIDRWLGRKSKELAKQTGGQEQQPAIRSLRQQLRDPMQAVGRLLFPFISTTFAAIGGIVLILFIGVYIAVDPKLYRHGLIHLVPRARKLRFQEVLDEISTSLRQWLIARLLAMLAIGLVTAGVLALLQVRAWAALGVLAGLLEFIPFFGPIASAVPAVAIALVDSPQKAFYVVLAFVAIQQLEGNVVTPLLLKKRVDVPPVLTIVAVASMGAALGIGGMLVAEPLLVATLIAVKMLYVEDTVGDDVTSENSR